MIGTPTIWENLDFLRMLWTRGMRPESRERDSMKERVLRSLHDVGLTVELSFRDATDGAQVQTTDSAE